MAAGGEGSVGIVTRTRDRGPFVVRAVASVLAQRHAHWHLVLVNDGGDPATLRQALAGAGLDLPAARLTILDHPTPRGRAAAFNRGLAALATQFVACLDDDDTWHPDFLAELLALHARTAPVLPALGGVASGVTALLEDLVPGPDGQPQILPLGEDGLPNAFRRNDFLIDPIAYATYRHDLYPVQWLLRREAVAALGGFPQQFEVMEDRAFLQRFLEHWPVATLDRPLAFHHRRRQRGQDTAQSAALNTLDNPSYDWRRFGDLAAPSVVTPPGGGAVDLPRLLRAVGASVVRELNRETSAIWHKVDGEAAGLRNRIAALEAAAGLTPAMPRPEGGAALWSLWPVVAGRPAGHVLPDSGAVLDRLRLSHAAPGDGVLLHIDPEARLFQLQVPQTGDWCALELALDLPAPDGAGLCCEALVSLPGGGLFETALVQSRRGLGGRLSHRVSGHQVHAAPAAGAVRLSRCFSPGALIAADLPKLSIILPRQATNLRLVLHDLVVRPDRAEAEQGAPR